MESSIVFPKKFSALKKSSGNCQLLDAPGSDSLEQSKHFADILRAWQTPTAGCRSALTRGTLTSYLWHFKDGFSYAGTIRVLFM